MAKKKPESTAKSESPKKPAAKKAAPAASKSPGAKASKPATGGGAMPMIDTDFAAAAAARMLVGRRDKSQVEDDKRGSLIEQLKSDLNKGHAATVSNVLDKDATGSSQKRPDLPFGQRQKKHNQTFGADVTRSGVPRRTAG